MSIKKSKGLAQKLEEAAEIAQEYYRESDDADEKKKYEQIWKVLVGLHRVHVGPEQITYIECVVHTK